MNELVPILALSAGLVVGAVVVWLIMRGRAASAASDLRAELQPQLATLQERVNAKEQQIGQLESALHAEEDQKTQLAMQLQQESNASAAAGEKSKGFAAGTPPTCGPVSSHTAVLPSPIARETST